MLAEEAKENTKAGAIAFVKHYVEVMNYSGQQGTTNTFRHLSHDCVQCDAIANVIDRAYRGGGRIEGEGWFVKSARVVPNAGDDGDTFVEARIQVHPQRVYDSPTSTPRTYKGNDNRLMVFTLSPRPGRWAVAAVSILDER